MCALHMGDHGLSVPRSQYRSQPTDRAIRSQPIAEADDRKYRSQRLDADVMQPYLTDRSFPIAPIAPIADRSRDQLTDRSSQKSDRNRSQRIHTSKVMYFTVLEPRHHYEPMGKCTLGANNIVFYISDPPFGMVCRRGSS